MSYERNLTRSSMNRHPIIPAALVLSVGLAFGACSAHQTATPVASRAAKAPTVESPIPVPKSLQAQQYISNNLFPRVVGLTKLASSYVSSEGKSTFARYSNRNGTYTYDMYFPLAGQRSLEIQADTYAKRRSAFAKAKVTDLEFIETVLPKHQPYYLSSPYGEQVVDRIYVAEQTHPVPTFRLDGIFAGEEYAVPGDGLSDSQASEHTIIAPMDAVGQANAGLSHIERAIRHAALLGHAESIYNT
jgi:hypothetical protein